MHAIRLPLLIAFIVFECFQAHLISAQTCSVPPDEATEKEPSAAVGKSNDQRQWFSELAERADRLPPADRALHLHELDEILWASRVLVGKHSQTVQERHHAHETLAGHHHIRCLPALFAVAHDEKEDLDLRERAMKTIASFPAPHVVDHLIPLLTDPEEAVARTTNEALYHVTNRSAELNDALLARGADEREKLKAAWITWWGENRAAFSQMQKAK